MDNSNNGLDLVKVALNGEIDTMLKEAVDISTASDDINILIEDLLDFQKMGYNVFFVYNGIPFYSLIDNDITIKKKLEEIQAKSKTTEEGQPTS